ncbi:helix-turn-helix transcriptional regulator [Sphingopyxis sp. OPL5]|nr:helix-turn-helix transcriptional regulator [Sphingopyxis sp. OPL5]
MTMILSELRSARKRSGISIDRIARQMGVSEPTVSRWLRGQALTVDALDQLCVCIGTDLKTLIEQASDPGTDRLSLRQERILAADRRLSLLFFLILNGAQRESLERDFAIEPERCEDLVERLARLGLVAKTSSGRLRPLVSRSVRWQPGGPLATAFEQTVMSMMLGPGFGREGTHYVSQFALLDEEGREYVFSRFEALCEEILRGPGYVGHPSQDRQWSSLFMMTRPIGIAEMQSWMEADE